MMQRDLGRPGVLAGQRRPRRRPPGYWFLIIAAAGIITALFWPRTQQTRSDATSVHTVAGAAPALVTAAPVTEETLEDAILADESGTTETSIGRVRFGPPDPFAEIQAIVQRGQTLFDALIAAGLPRGEAGSVVAALKPLVDFRRIRPGDRFEGLLWLSESLIEGTFYHGDLDRFRLRRHDGRLEAEADPIPVVAATTVVSGVVESSLFDAIYAAGERPSLIMSFVDLFSWDFDFGQQTRKGDRFAMLIEKHYANDKFYGYGPIQAARYISKTFGVFEACWHDGSDDLRGYYHPDGTSVRGAFLRAPVKYSRISSGYSLSRLHPVLGVRRPHRGIDYAAPTGTPVYAVADGIVLDARWMGGAGRAVRIRHPNGWITSYSHLSKILVRKGQHVRQGQMVGRVGSSGYATGPHLDYRIKIGGKFVNPLKVKFPRGKKIPAAERPEFEARCRLKLDQLETQVAALASSSAP
ncbi:MAG: M23 family peptidase [Candidatus Dadabacteria bacterium]|nr:MAG: M23 family peptidase [Candidatus Dadabacteria bacterium]